MTADLPLYLLPGMTRDPRIFDRLTPLLPNATVLDWHDPKEGESLPSYARRIAERVPAPRCFVGGVSFGGIVAQEVSRIIRPRGCFLISSIRDPAQLPPWLRMWRLMAGRNCSLLLNSIGHLASRVPKRVRTRSTLRITKLAGDKGAWHRWATSAVLSWHPDREASNIPICQIHGDADTTFPIRYIDPDVIIRSGGHVLPLTHPSEVADAMLAMMSDAA